MPQQVQSLGQGLEQYCVVPIPLKGCTPFKGYVKIQNIIYNFTFFSMEDYQLRFETLAILTNFQAWYM
jgi:hypothetical protein